MARPSQPLDAQVVASWLVMALGVLIYLFTLLPVLPPSMSADAVLLMQLGSAFEVLAFGLADSLNQSKAQALKAEREARVTQQTLAQRLEEQVRCTTAPRNWNGPIPGCGNWPSLMS